MEGERTPEQVLVRVPLGPWRRAPAWGHWGLLPPHLWPELCPRPEGAPMSLRGPVPMSPLRNHPQAEALPAKAGAARAPPG